MDNQKHRLFFLDSRSLLEMKMRLPKYRDDWEELDVNVKRSFSMDDVEAVKALVRAYHKDDDGRRIHFAYRHFVDLYENHGFLLISDPVILESLNQIRIRDVCCIDKTHTFETWQNCVIHVLEIEMEEEDEIENVQESGNGTKQKQENPEIDTFVTESVVDVTIDEIPDQNVDPASPVPKSGRSIRKSSSKAEPKKRDKLTKNGIMNILKRKHDDNDESQLPFCSATNFGAESFEERASKLIARFATSKITELLKPSKGCWLDEEDSSD